MSRSIDQRVVEMRFDNKNFEKNVQSTMTSLDKLKQKLNLTGASKGLENIDANAKRINLSGISNAVDSVSNKFTALEVMSITALANITNSAVNAGKRIASALTIEPIKTGFQEYETQINAVQTILANTSSKGTNLDDVNKALDELNTYADKTIYNFTEMTRNIGTFTAAGVDLETSVGSIKGIANLAAVSGSTSQQASNAMYQLSQALAAGKVSLMDWNSVVNAGMGGQVFQDALKRTATVMGKDVDGMIKKYGSFRESLTQGEWLTSDVLTKTLEQFTMAAEEGSEAWNNYKKSLMDEGYTEAQANEILKMANTATDAATKVKTFTQLWDTLKESAQSGWAQTWEILVGDFEEAKELLTGISDVVGNFINESSKARNELLQGWKDEGGRTATLDAFKNIFEGIINITKPIKEAFREIFPPLTVKQLTSFSDKLKELTGNFASFTEKHGPQIKSTFKGIFSVLDIVATVITKVASGVLKVTGSILGFTGGILKGTSSLGDWLSNLRDSVKEADLFGRAIDAIVGFLQNGIDKIREFSSYIGKKITMPGFEGMLTILKKVWEFITKIGSGIGDAFSDALRSGDISAGLDVLNAGIFSGILLGIKKFVSNLSGAFDDAKGILENAKDILGGIKGVLEAYQQDIKANVLLKIATAIGILAASILVLSLIKPERIDQSVGAIALLFAELMGAFAIFTKVSSKIQHVIRASVSIIAISSALLILSAALKVMSTMSWSELARGLTGIVIGLMSLVAAVRLLPDEAKLSGATKGIKRLSTSLLILSVALKIMSTMSWSELGRGLTGMAAGLIAMVAAINLLPKNTMFRASGMISLATSLVILGGALKIMATMSWGEIGRGLTVLAGALTAITLAMNLLPKNTALKSVGMVGLATSLVILGGALKIMATMSWEDIGRGLTVMGGALLELAIALNLMQGTLAGSAALLIATGALAILAPVMKILSSLSWEGIIKGLVALGGAFAVIGIAGYLLTPIIPAILGLAGACALIGVATLGVGVGLGLMAAGITALSVAVAGGTTAIVAGLSSIILGVIGLIPDIIASLGEGILVLCDVLIRCAPAIAETLLVLISEVLMSLETHAPTILDTIMKLLIGLLRSLRDNLPELIVVAMEVIGAFFQGVVNALKGVDTTTLLQGIAGVGLLTGLMYLLSGIAALIPAAMVGVLGMGVLIAELALVLAAVGALAQIPGLSWLIEEGGDFLQKIGTAIGQFVGGIVGGIAEGATSTLPKVGTNLSEFMKNLQPFLDGAKTIDAGLLEGVKSLSKVILTLTAANLIESITSWLTGGNSFTDFGKDLVEFGGYMKQYSEKVTGLDVNAVEASASAAKSLVKVANAIPGDGLFGFDGIDDFGKNIVTFGESMKKYGEKVKGINVEAITASADVAKKLVKVAKDIPDDGLFGSDGIDNFGKNIVSFSKSLGKYSDNIAKINKESIDNSINTIRKLADLITDIADVNTEGVNSFNSALSKLGKTGLSRFVSAFSNPTKEVTSAITKLTNSLVKAIETKSDLFNKSGVHLMKAFVKGISSYKSKITSSMENAAKAGVNAARGYYNNFYNAGSYLVTGFANGIGSNTYKAAAKAKAMAKAAETAARRELDINSPSRVFYKIGSFTGKGFINALHDSAHDAFKASGSMADSAKKGLSGAISKITDLFNNMDSQPVIRPVLDLSDIESGAGTINGMLNNVGIGATLQSISSGMYYRNQNGTNSDVVSAINKLGKSLGNTKGDTYNINGVSVDDDTNVRDAVQTIIRAAIMERRV